MLERPASPDHEEHTSSYYAASANRRTDFAPLEGETNADVAVVGAGFTGLSAAIALAERGHRVALIEANRIGWGASGRNGGQLIGGMSGSEAFERQLGEDGRRFLRETFYEGNRIVEERVARYGIACDLKRGWMYAATKPRHMKWLEADCREHMDQGHPFEMVDRDRLATMLGTRAYHGGLIDHGSGHLHPLNLAIGEADAATGLGVAVHEHSPVVGIEHGRKAIVRTPRGSVHADFVVLAGGAYHRLERQRLKGLLFPTGSYIVATEPLGTLAGQLIANDVAVSNTDMVLDYFRLSGDGRMLFGGRCNYSNREPSDIAGSIRPRMVEIFPQLAGKRIEHAWGGKIGIIINRVPAIGRLAPNVFYSQGYSGHGVNFAHLAGVILAEAVTGTRGRFDLFERIRHTRIPVDGWAGSQILALGMIYYRLRDML
ncbi:MAG: FAD-dependent oxidoreductase [Rhizobiales bacterium]|nr:FAD-dependent oxidoreductase [Hyphomicrobiales bacterium]